MIPTPTTYRWHLISRIGGEGSTLRIKTLNFTVGGNPLKKISAGIAVKFEVGGNLLGHAVGVHVRFG